MKTESDNQKLRAKQSSIGLKTALKIMEKWGCTGEQQRAILDVGPKTTFHKYKKNPASAKLSNSQLERISYLLNIHSHLRILFDNSNNVYGFMSMANDNPYFNGKSPLELISTGNFGALYETAKRIDALRSGAW